MAALLVAAMSDPPIERKNIHSFFRPQQIIDIPVESRSTNQHEAQLHQPEQTSTIAPTTDTIFPKTTKASRKSRADDNTEDASEVDPNQARRKRQKTTSPNPESIPTDAPECILVKSQPQLASIFQKPVKSSPVEKETPAQPAPDPEASLIDTKEEYRLEDVQPNAKQPDTTSSAYQAMDTGSPTDMIGPATSTPRRSSRKILHLNIQTGTIGSPPQKKSTGSFGDRKKRGRPRKSCIASLKYGSDPESRIVLAAKIDDILDGKIKHVAPATRAKAKKSRPRKCTPPDPTKAPHPFFSGKPPLKSSGQPDQQSAQNGDIPKTVFPSRTGMPREKGNSAAMKEQSGFQTFGASKKIFKFPGAIEPAWPSCDMMHVRGTDDTCVLSTSLPLRDTHTEKKAKYIAPVNRLSQDIIKDLAISLDLKGIKDDLAMNSSTDVFQLPDPNIRLPLKHFESGIKLQKRIRNRIQGALPQPSLPEESSDDEITAPLAVRTNSHPAIANLYNSLTTRVSAFDRSMTEHQNWTRKYAPSTAADVLQPEHKGKEAYILKDWLQALTVMAVESGSVIGSQPRADKKAGRRKKQKKNNPDDFIVSTDDSDNNLTEVSDIDDLPPLGSQGAKRTVVRSSEHPNNTKGSKLTNTVLVSGPNGCGKTAMIYAVAKELNFEVFEINAGSRRAGKDILDKVGDMTRNHLVQNNGPKGTADDEDALRLASALAADLESGRQGTMNSFFNVRAKPAKAKVIPRSDPKKDPEAVAKPEPAKVKLPTKSAKQSLILLEEADILFEQDKNFWSTVMDLVIQSKRPVIITCNDERFIPVQALSLHAILRLTAPPIDLAVDYTLLVAACEGHALERVAVEALYRSRDYDLRACLTELEVHCQMAVGDRRGGLEWFYPRWPKGCDRDSKGHTVRVISENTYHKAMGWFGGDVGLQPVTPDDAKEMMQRAWDGWSLHPSAICHGSYQDSTTADSSSRMEIATLGNLYDYDAAADALSLADCISYGQLATGNELPLNPELPDVFPKSRDDFVLGHTLLSSTIEPYRDLLARELALTIMSRAGLRAASQPTPDSDAIRGINVELVQTVEHRSSVPANLCRQDLAIAFDPIAVNPHHPTASSYTALEPSVFGRTTAVIIQDVAPYVRSVVAYDAKLSEERAKLSSLLSQGGNAENGKEGTRKMRKTRAAFSALEGGKREETRKEKYFEGLGLDEGAVGRTGVESWRMAADKEIQRAVTDLADKAATVIDAAGADESGGGQMDVDVASGDVEKSVTTL